jgi:hypothetical protein
MIAKQNDVTITVERETRTSDGGGGYTTTSDPIEGSPFSGRRILRSLRQVTVIEGRPGDALVTQLVLVFPVGAVIKSGDICTVNKEVFSVIGVRTYRRSVQADVEAVR